MTSSAPWRLRPARSTDIPAIRALMDVAIPALLAPFLTPEQVQASFAVMGLDSQLIADGDYLVAEAADGRIVACGGWSRRATLFGGDHTAGRSARLLDPATEAARVRAMYTHPDWTRRGLGKAIIARCEAEAAAAGFARVELAATLGGEPLYLACGYAPVRRFDEPTPGGVAVPLILMSKAIGD